MKSPSGGCPSDHPSLWRMTFLPKSRDPSPPAGGRPPRRPGAPGPGLPGGPSISPGAYSRKRRDSWRVRPAAPAPPRARPGPLALERQNRRQGRKQCFVVPTKPKSRFPLTRKPAFCLLVAAPPIPLERMIPSCGCASFGRFGGRGPQG